MVTITVDTPIGRFSADAAAVEGCMALKRTALITELYLLTMNEHARFYLIPTIALRVMYCDIVAQAEADASERLTTALYDQSVGR